MGPVNGDRVDEDVFGSTIGDRPDRFRLREPSGRICGLMTVVVVMVVGGGREKLIL